MNGKAAGTENAAALMAFGMSSDMHLIAMICRIIVRMSVEEYDAVKYQIDQETQSYKGRHCSRTPIFAADIYCLRHQVEECHSYDRACRKT